MNYQEKSTLVRLREAQVIQEQAIRRLVDGLISTEPALTQIEQGVAALMAEVEELRERVAQLERRPIPRGRPRSADNGD